MWTQALGRNKRRAPTRGVTRLMRSTILLKVVALIQRLVRGKSARGGALDDPKLAAAVFTRRMRRLWGLGFFPWRRRVDAPTTVRPRWTPAGPTQPALTPESAQLMEPGGTFLNDSYTNHAGTRAYKLYIPSAYQGQTLPLVVMLHGCKQNPDDFAAGTRMNVLAEEHPCFVLYPAQPSTANGSKCWNWFDAVHQRRGQGEPSIIAGITRHIAKTYPVDRRRVYVAGLSAGGAMAAVMGATYPDLYAAVGVHSGLPYAVAQDVSSALALMKNGAPLGRRHADGVSAARRSRAVIPTIVFHGDQDTRVHPRNSDHVIEQHTGPRSRDGAAPEGAKEPKVTSQRGYVPSGHSYTRTIYHNPRGRPILEQWQVHGAGHAWSGGSVNGSYTDPKGPDATREMIRFFYEHPRRRGFRAILRWLRRKAHAFTALPAPELRK